MTRILDGIKLDFKDVMLVPKISALGSRKDFDHIRSFRNHPSLEGFGIVAANMDTVGTTEMAEALASHGMFTALHKFYEVGQLNEFINKHETDGVLDKVFFTFGTSERDLDKLERFYGTSQFWRVRNICIDVANGYSAHFLSHIREIRERFQNQIIMAGNVCTSDVTNELCRVGVDIVKVGIGPGLACKTREVTGVGYPQISAILESADAAHGLGKYICADGGCKTVGDIAKAFGAGADFVMLGGMLAGTYESIEDKSVLKEHTWTVGYKIHSKIIEDQEIPFYGMSSKKAMDKHYGGVAGHRTSEGRELTVKYKGPVAGVVQEIKAGIASSGAYIGASNIKDFPKCSTFCRVN